MRPSPEKSRTSSTWEVGSCPREPMDGVQLLEVDCDADTAVFVRDGDHGAGVW